jgi:hypothetical protein
MSHILRQAAYVAAVLAIACAAVYAASLLPITNPATAWGVCVTAGNFAALAALTWLPCPCHGWRNR